jgi:hypothetical protein
MEGLVEQLRRFNRKERFYLIGSALGNEKFALSDKFRQSLNQELALDIPLASLVAMDYHLNWIHAAILFAASDGSAVIAHDLETQIAGNQEDVDLLIAYDDHDVTQIVLVEAKGATSWTNKQLRSKAERLKPIFGDDGSLRPFVRPYFVIASPRRPKQLDDRSWPKWMKEPLHWIELKMPHDTQRITRCDTAGSVTAIGTFWKIVNAPLSAPAGEDIN